MKRRRTVWRLCLCLRRRRCRLLCISLSLFALTVRTLWTALSLEARAAAERSPPPLLPRRSVATRRARLQNDRANATSSADADAPSCLWHHSVAWLRGPRLGNANDTVLGAAPALARRLVLRGTAATPGAAAVVVEARDLLARSLCPARAPLLRLDGTDDDSADDDEPRRLRRWQTRLAYLAVHTHQHRPARREAGVVAREDGEDPAACRGARAARGLGPLDYECGEARFLVVRLFGNGLGANLRLAAVPALMAGLATDRVVLIVSAAPVGPDFLRDPWPLAGCPRGDLQCLFLPSSPCVLTHAELAAAPVLRREEVRRVFRNGTLAEDRQAERTLVLRLGFRPQREPASLRARLGDLARPLAAALARDLPPREAARVRRAAEALARPEEPPPSTTAASSYGYYGAGSPLFHGLLLYAMRPHPRAALAVRAMVRAALPPDFAADRAVGLAIRASDKCDAESECPPFAQYVRSLRGLWTGSATDATDVVVTTESRQVMRELTELVANASGAASLPFPVRFVTNQHDVLQDTGFFYGNHETNYSTYESMISALTSLQLQMMTRLTVGNCCSNFHLLLSDFLSEGCGMATDSRFVCLQDHPDPEFRICCQWDKSEECDMRRKENVAIEPQ